MLGENPHVFLFGGHFKIRHVSQVTAGNLTQPVHANTQAHIDIIWRYEEAAAEINESLHNQKTRSTHLKREFAQLVVKTNNFVDVSVRLSIIICLAGLVLAMTRTRRQVCNAGNTSRLSDASLGPREC